MDDEILCIRCAKLGPTCCQRSDVYVSPGDVQRISKYTGQEDFTEYRGAENLLYLDQDDDPVWLRYVFRPDGSRRVMKGGMLGKCLFLKPTGCTLPLDVRPLVCRIFPYMYNADGLYAEISEECPVHLLSPGQHIDQYITGIKDAERWHQMLYNEIILEETHEDRIDLRPAV